MPGNTSSTELTYVSFRVSAPVRYGETIFVVGDVPALGSGDYAYGVQLVTTPEKFPEWFTQNAIPLVRGRKISYKYAIFSGGNFARWEDLESTRSLVVREDGNDQIVEDTVQVDEHFKSANHPARQQPFQKKVSSRDIGPQPHTRERRKKWLGLDNDDGVIVVSCFLPVKISRVPGGKSSTATLAGDNFDHDTNMAEYANCGLPEKLDQVGLASSVGGGASSISPNLRSWSSNNSEGRSSFAWSIEWDESALLSRKKSSAADHMRVLYIGYPRCDHPILPSEQESLATALVRFRCIPVFLPTETRDLHYHVYCYDTLRKLFHHQVDVYAPLPTRWWNGPVHEKSWIAYRSANQAFAEKVVEVYNEGDIIWIHGYELLLLPSLLKRRLQAGHPHIGLFVHSPFPSSEIFRTLSVRDDILRGMLNADQIGFHLYEYARPFLSCCHRILGIQHSGNENDGRGVLTVDYQGRRVVITVCQAGIEPEIVRSTLRSPRVFAKAKAILDAACITPPTGAPSIDSDCEDPTVVLSGSSAQHKPENQIVLVGLDAHELLRGIHFKLIAFESFLEENPELADRLCLVQVCLRVERENEESNEARTLARRISRRINHRFPRPAGSRPAVCLLEWATCTLADRVALFSVADIFLNTPLRAGLDLPVFEFTVVAEERKNVDGPWVRLFSDDLDPHVRDIRNEPTLILSEFTAAFRVLPASLRCTPWREVEMRETLLLALRMNRDERSVRNTAALDYVNKQVESGWAQRVLSDIKSAVRSSGPEKKNDGLTPAGLGLGLQFRAIEFRPNFRHLRDELIMDAYRTALQRLIILDYGGTTVSDEYVPHDAFSQAHKHHKFEFRFRPKGEAIVPSPRMIRTLQTLAADPCNTVFIVSGRERHELETAFADIPGIGLTAEHGCFYSWGNPNRAFHHVHSTQPFLAGADASETPGSRLTRSDSPGLSAVATTKPPLVAAPAPGPVPEHLMNRRRGRSSSLGSFDNPMARRTSSGQELLARSANGEVNRKCNDRLQRSWVTLSDHFDDSWMDLSEQIMDVYTQRTDGTYIERKGSSIVWQFRDAEPEFGMLQASELHDHLHGVLKAFPIEVVLGKGYVEVCPQGVDKGNACAHIVGMFWPNEPLPDFVLCLGDDIADECMFQFFLGLYAEHETHQVPASEAMQLFSSPLQIESSILSRETSLDGGISERRNQHHGLDSSKLFTCVVGEKPSVAQYYVNDVDEVGELLGVLAKVSTKLEVSRSSTELRKLDASAPDQVRHTFDSFSALQEHGAQQASPFLSFSHQNPLVATIQESQGEDDYHSVSSSVAATAASSASSTSSPSDLDASQDLQLHEGLVSASPPMSLQSLKANSHKSVLDLRIHELARQSEMMASVSMPALSEYFSLDVSQPTSTTAQEYLDLIADDDDGIVF